MTGNLHVRWQYVVASFDDPDASAWFYETADDALEAIKDLMRRNPEYAYAIFKRLP